MIGYIYIIYKDGIKEMYIGSTINLKKRKDSHIYCCNNSNDTRYNLKVYQFIRENGGFDTWTFEMLEQYECMNKRELEIREQYYLDINKEYILNVQPSYRSEEDRKKNKALIDKERHKRNWNDEEKREILKQKNREYQKTTEYNKTDKRKEYEKKYREENREKIKEYKRQYRQRKKQEKK